MDDEAAAEPAVVAEAAYDTVNMNSAAMQTLTEDDSLQKASFGYRSCVWRGLWLLLGVIVGLTLCLLLTALLLLLLRQHARFLLSSDVDHTKPLHAAADGPYPHPLNAYRMSRLFDRLQQGEPITVGVIGGSNSAGHGLATQAHNVYYYLLDWLNHRFPTTSNSTLHTLRNHARPATTSAFASWCLDDLFPGLNGTASTRAVDLLIVDYAANDFQQNENRMAGDRNDPYATVQANMERLTRRVIRLTDRTTLMFVYFVRDSGTVYYNAEDEHEVVARRYGIPSVSLRQALSGLRSSSMWSGILGSYLKYLKSWGGPPTNTTFLRDPAHASDLGHQLVFTLIKDKLQALLDEYTRSSRRSFIPGWLWTTADANSSSAANSGSNSHMVPLPLPPPSLPGLDAATSCRFTSGNMDEHTAFKRLSINKTFGWQYATQRTQLIRSGAIDH